MLERVRIFVKKHKKKKKAESFPRTEIFTENVFNLSST